MILIVTAGIIVVFALLLGIKRSNKRDLFHLLAVLLSVAGAYVLTVLFADRLYAFAENRFDFNTEGLPFLRQMAIAAARPALIAVLFAALFIILGLIFHFIASGKKRKKPSVIVKLLLNLISGAVIAVVFLVPVDYYASNMDKFNDVLEIYDMAPEEELPDLEKFRLGSDLPAPVTEILTKVEYEGETYAFGKCVECAEGFSVIADYSGTEDLGGLIDKLNSDEEAERLYAIFSAELLDTVKDPNMKTILAQAGRIPSKLNALSGLKQLKDMAAGKVDPVATLKTLLENAETDSCAALASLCTTQELKMINRKFSLNAPLLAEIIRTMPELPDKSAESVDREARSIAYIMNIDPLDPQSAFNYNDLDPALVAKCISDSYLLQNAYITVTDHGTIPDPLGVTSNGSNLQPLVFDYYVSTIIYHLDKTYGFGPDSDLYKSMMAFFDVKDI